MEEKKQKNVSQNFVLLLREVVWTVMIWMKALVLLSGVCVFVPSAIAWHKNNHAPRLTVEAEIVARRTDVGRTVHLNGPSGKAHFGPARTCYVTFQMEDGSRMEFYLAADNCGRMAKGTRGRLTYRGTRYLGFEPIR
ncbi:MAG: DUF2500 domain-containing protein [Oscillospiraceae bacterium]|nr:DUF2500 domain-containing protein [Oscillospiraceae bacterium]